MDSFTQIVLGIATAELCAGEKIQRKKTLLYGAILGTIPDLDVVVGMFMDPVNGVAIHRGLSHSLLFFLLLSPILGFVISKLEKGRISFKSATLLAFWCLFTHVLLDIFTSWGTQVFWPLPNRIALKTIFVIDPLYTLPLLILLVIALRKPQPIRKKYVWRAVYVSTSYLMITCGIKLYVLQQFKDALQQQGIAYNDLIVKPTAFNCILWNANVASDEAYLLSDYSLFDSKPVEFTSYAKNQELEMQLAGNTDFEKLKKVSEGWYIVTMKDRSYYFNDLRFGLLTTDPQHPQFAFSYIFREDNGILKAHEVPKQKRDGATLMKGIFTRIQGN
jgi:inner membrane protein